MTREAARTIPGNGRESPAIGKSGGSKKPAWWKRPLKEAKRVPPQTRQSAFDPAKSRRTTEKIAMALGDFGVSVSPNTVAWLLHQMGYSLRVNHKKLSTDF